MILAKFSGGKGADPKHYFLKMNAFLDTYCISKIDKIINVFLDSLEDDALDLYLSLETDKKADLIYLEHIFSIHFKPKKHDILGQSDMLKMSKRLDESISEYYLRLSKEAREFSVGLDMLKAIFVQGLPVDYQKHIALAVFTI